MTLKITRFFKDALDKQAKISHFNNEIQFNTPEKIKTSWKQKLNEQFGELFLNDANYLAICKVADAPESHDDDDEVDEAEDSIDKTNKKFKDLLENVFGTEVPKSDIKQLDNYLLVKITTK